MKRILILILITSCFFEAKAQLKDYFIPTSEYFNETFLFQSEKWENENGQFQTKNRVKYYLDHSGNYKKYIENTNYRYNVPNMTMKVHQFFYVSDDKVANIYFYIEGISEELEQMGYDNRDKNNIILKYPSAQWTDKSDPDVTEYFKSEFGKITTEYGKYDNCIVVTKTSKAKTSKFKYVEKYSYKYYYAYKIGLVRTENYENGKLLKMEMDYGGTLMDNFSEYSFYQKEKAEKERLEAERNRVEEKKKLLAFLEERRNTIYDYKKINSNDYKKIEKDIKREIKNIIDQNKLDNISFTIEANYTIDTLFRKSQKIIILDLENSEIKKTLTDYLAHISLSPVYLNKYSVNSKANYKFNFTQSTNELFVNKNKNGLTLKQGSQDIYEKNKSYINNEISNNPNGKYKIRLNKSEINNEKHETIKYLDYKNYGGSSSAFLSLIIPGTGDYFVNGGKGSMLGNNAHPIITTISVYGLIGTGFYFKNQSSNNYDLYHRSTDQSDIDKYYDLANSQNKTAWTLIGLGGVVWIADIYWVIKTGTNNKRIEKETKKKLNIAFVPSFNNSYAFSLTYNF